jgi:glycosyltransferase involved in cell wall biosynthesis
MQIAQICNGHKVAIIPSVCDEAFGIVALEAIACGRAVVGTVAGGLPEAIGPCGLTYPSTSVSDLAARLEQLALEPSFLDAMQKYAQRHLAKHTRTAVAAKYLRFMSDCFPNLAFAGGRSTNTADSLGLVEATHG